MTEGEKRSVAPDGGWGWVIIAGCFLTTICTRAITRCISIFFVEFHTHFSSDYSSTAWIPSLVDCTTMLCAPLGSYLANHLSCRVAVMVGGLLSSVGLVLSSFASSLEFLYLSLGILTGLGFALSYTPAISMVGIYFSERKALAYGIAMSGSGIGTVVLAPVVQILIDSYSWRGAVLILGGLVSHLCVCGALMRPLSSNKQMNNGREFKGDMLVSELSGAKLCTELDMEEAKALNKNLKVTELDFIAINTDKKRNGKLREEHEPENGQEQTESSLKTQLHPELVDLVLNVSLQVETNIDSALTGSRLASLEQQYLKRAKSVLNDSKLPVDSEILDLIQAKTVLGISEITDSRFSKSKLIDLKPNNSVTPVLADSELTGSADSKTLCEMALSKNKAGENRDKKGCIIIPSLVEYSFLLIPDFLLLSVSFLFLAFGCNVPFVYIVPYSLSIGFSHQLATLLMSVLGVMGIVGNITFGWISDRKFLRRYRVVSYLVAVGLEGLSCLFVPLFRSFPLLLPFVICYGYFDGAYVALLPVVISDTVGPTHLSSALGVVYFLHAIPYLISPPIGGWLLDNTGSYTAVFLLCGSSLICSASVLAVVTVAQCCNRRSFISSISGD